MPAAAPPRKDYDFPRRLSISSCMFPDCCRHQVVEALFWDMSLVVRAGVAGTGRAVCPEGGDIPNTRQYLEKPLE